MIGTALSHTPWWVYVVFVLVLSIGIKALRTREVPIWTVAITPSVFAVWGVSGLAWVLGGYVQGWLLFAACLLLGALVGGLLVRPGTVEALDGGRVRLLGSPVTLLLILAIFISKYALGFWQGVSPGVSATGTFMLTDAAVTGTVIGMFVGRFAAIVRRCGAGAGAGAGVEPEPEPDRALSMASADMAGWRFHHLGLPTDTPRPGERYSAAYGLYTSDDPCSLVRVQWHRYDADSPLPALLRQRPHVALQVPDLARAIEGRSVILGPYEPVPGYHVAIVDDGGISVELVQTTLTQDQLWARAETEGVLYRDDPAARDETARGLSGASSTAAA